MHFKLPQFKAPHTLAERMKYREMVKDEFKVPYTSGIISHPRVSNSFIDEEVTFKETTKIEHKKIMKRAATTKLKRHSHSSTQLPKSETKDVSMKDTMN